jgi:hypothetical protein
MNLKDFVAQSLREIFEGVTEAQRAVQTLGGKVNPKVQRVFSESQHGGTNLALGWSKTGDLIHVVEFDVAVTATEGEETKAGIGVVANIFALGTQLKSDQLSSAVSRIQFRVPVSLPDSVTDK